MKHRYQNLCSATLMPLLFHLKFESVLTHGMLTLMFHRLADVPLPRSLFSFSLLYNAFSGVIEDKVKDDLKEMVS